MSELKVDKVSSRTGGYLALNTLSHKNLFINGDMAVAQRGTSKTGITGSNYYTCDRYKFFISNLGTFTMSQDTDVPTGQGFATSMKFDCTVANAAPAAGSYLFFAQYVEAQNCQYLKYGTSSAESLTLSFWVKSSKTGTYCFDLRTPVPTPDRLIGNSYTINTASTWEKKTITFAGDTVKAINNNNGIGLQCSFWLGAGSNFSSGTLQTSWGNYVEANRAVGQVNLADNTANDWAITGIQLEANTTATSYNFEPYDLNLQRCQRYCYAYADYGGGNTNDNRQYSANYGGAAAFVRITYPVTMRLEPTTTYSLGGGAVSTDYSNASNFQGYDSDDNSWYVYDFIAQAEL